MNYHTCDSDYHLSFDCPKTRTYTDDRSGSSNDRYGKKGDIPWKYIAPADDNSTVEVNGNNYY